MRCTIPPHVSVAMIFDLSRYMYIRNTLLIRLLKILRQPTFSDKYLTAEGQSIFLTKPDETITWTGVPVEVFGGLAIDSTQTLVYDILQLNVLHTGHLMIQKLLTLLLKTLRQPTTGFALLEPQEGRNRSWAVEEFSATLQTDGVTIVSPVSPDQFHLQNTLYRQTDGVTIVSPVSPVAANLFPRNVETKAFRDFAHLPRTWLSYTDDILAIIPATQSSKPFQTARMNNAVSCSSRLKQRTNRGPLVSWTTFFRSTTKTYTCRQVFALEHFASTLRQTRGCWSDDQTYQETMLGEVHTNGRTDATQRNKYHLRLITQQMGRTLLGTTPFKKYFMSMMLKDSSELTTPYNGTQSN
ncbi:hypothetical protein T265_05134 [Opisthorchis viverrini]|uniref:Reverse transcriptase domain-containing protein n=1 Tax=Opisthorchis viverrini TaxID=6198 RepID=A0A074ZLG4_OPIVI|nr:hypothetical protein T265_05134 [Opisthorchis viverrini]KER27931.1 hypothetical protein T265_05134 [Opisthorchis viverrini]